MDSGSGKIPEKVKALNQLKAKYDRSKARISVRYEKSDAEKLVHFAEVAGMDITSYIRVISLNPQFKVVPAQPRINLETKAEIQKIGVNINQMARAMNNRYEVKDFKEVEKELSKMNETLKNILAKMDS